MWPHHFNYLLPSIYALTSMWIIIANPNSYRWKNLPKPWIEGNEEILEVDKKPPKPLCKVIKKHEKSWLIKNL